MRRFLYRVLAFFKRSGAERELEREIAAHLALMEQHYRTRGLSPQQAQRAARLALGGIEPTKERHRDARSLPWLEDLRRDVPYALRAFARNSLFTVTAIVTIALGVGVTTTMFSVINAILLRPLPYDDSNRLVRVAENITIPGPSGPRPARRITMTQDQFFEWRSRTKTLSHMAVSGGGGVLSQLATPSGNVRISTSGISPNLFEMLKVRPLIGRTLSPDDERPDANAVVISAGVWERLFGSDPGVLGRSIEISRRQFVIVGVMPPDFVIPSRITEVWYPLAPRAGQGDAQYGFVLARLAPGVSLETATAEANAIGTALVPATGGATNSGVPAAPPPTPTGATMGGGTNVRPGANAPRFQVLREKELTVSAIRPPLTLLGGAVAAVLLIVCANVANLLLVRSTARQREIGVRIALGAGRGRIMRQVLTESVVLSLAGGAVGVLIATAGVQMVKALSTVDTPQLFQVSANMPGGSMLPRINELKIDPAIFLFALGISLVVGVIFSLAPVLHVAGRRYAEAISIGLTSRANASTPSRTRVRSVLVVAQLVMATALLVGAGLFLNSFTRLLNVETGYDTHNVVNFQLVFPPGGAVPQRMALIETLITRLEAHPAIESAGYTNIAPFMALTEVPGIFVPPGSSREEMSKDPLRPQGRAVTHGFLQTLGARLLEGRWLTEADGAGQPKVMLVNRSLATRYFGSASPVGALVRLYRQTDVEQTWQIVGVVNDLRQARLDEEPFPLMYIDIRQLLEGVRPGPQPFGIPSIAVRGALDAGGVATAARAIVRELDAGAGIDGVATLEYLRHGSLVRPRFYAVLTGVFALLAGVLAAVGIYGVLAYSVLQRTTEIGVRMALGAERGTVMRQVLRQGLLLALIGVAAGSACAIGASRYLEGMLYGVTPVDVPTYAVIAVAFTGVTLLASYVPARRATRVDPVVALRCE
jgi:putative ABC transport system permease protein